jgi:hypothetical protein
MPSSISLVPTDEQQVLEMQNELLLVADVVLVCQHA